jgi:hypothetical protein
MDAYDIAVLAVLYGCYIRGNPRVIFMKVNDSDTNWIVISGTSRCDGLNNVSVEEIIVRYHENVLSPSSGWKYRWYPPARPHGVSTQKVTI